MAVVVFVVVVLVLGLVLALGWPPLARILDFGFWTVMLQFFLCGFCIFDVGFWNLDFRFWNWRFWFLGHVLDPTWDKNTGHADPGRQTSSHPATKLMTNVITHNITSPPRNG